MLTKNIVFTNFQINKTTLKISSIFKNLKNLFFKKIDRLLISFSDKYKYSFKSKELKKYKKFKTINIVGMGGSALGAEAIYSFLKFKIKKNFFFFKQFKT